MKDTTEPIDLYRLELAYEIQENWAFQENAVPSGTFTAIVFRALSSGERMNMVYTDRSGYSILGEAGHTAI